MAVTEKKTVQIMLLNADTGAEEANALPITDAINCDYVDEEPIVNAIGGIPAGKTYPQGNVYQVLHDLLHPYVKPAIGAATANPSGAVREKGTSLKNIAINVTTVKKSAAISKVELFKSGSSIGTVSSPKPSGGAETFTYVGPIESDCNLSVTVTDTENGSTSKTITSYTFVYPIYIGLLDAATKPTEALIEALEKRIVVKGTQTYTSNEEGKAYCIACPPGMKISKILDPNQFDSTAAFQSAVVPITGLDGTQQNYTVYWSGLVSKTNYKMTFQV